MAIYILYWEATCCLLPLPNSAFCFPTQSVPLCTKQPFSPIIYHRNHHSHVLYFRLLMNSWHSATGIEAEKNCLFLLSFHLFFLTLVVVLFSLVHYFCELLRRHTLPGGKTFLQVWCTGYQLLQRGAWEAKARPVNLHHCHHCYQSRVQYRVSSVGADAPRKSAQCMA